MSWNDFSHRALIGFIEVPLFAVQSVKLEH